MNGLVEFLLREIAADEAVAQEADGTRLLAWSQHDRMVIADAGHMQTFTPTRVLAECEAKRRIVDRAQGWEGPGWWPDDILRLLALPYADRPGFREEWRA